MKFSYLVLFINLAALFVSAQPENAHWTGQQVVNGRSYYTYGNNVSLRIAASIDADKIASLPINTNVEIIEVFDETYSVYGITAPWVKVKAGGTTGYLVSGFLALRSIELGDDSKLLYTRTLSDYGNSYRIKIRRAWQDRFVELGTFDLGVGNFKVELSNSRGLKNVDHILKVDFLAEACGENGGRSYFVIDLNKDDLLYLGSYRSVGDGGMFHQSEDLVFPDDQNGLEGIIIYKGEEGADNEEMGEYRTVSKVKHYSWSDVADGKTIDPFTYK